MTTCADLQLFETICYPDFKMELKPYIGSELETGQSCFSQAYGGLSLTDLIVSKSGSNDAEGDKCVAATGVGQSSKFYSSADLQTVMTAGSKTESLFFSLSECGAVATTSTNDQDETITTYTTTLMSDFEGTGVITTEQMTEVDVACRYKLNTDGIVVEVMNFDNDDLVLDNVEENNKVADGDISEINAENFSHTITVDGGVLGEGEQVVLGADVSIEFTNDSGVDTAYFIGSCTATNGFAVGDASYQSLLLIEDGCPVSDSSNVAYAEISPSLVNDSKTLEFSQFAYVTDDSNAAPVLAFALSCVIELGEAPSCGGNRRSGSSSNSSFQASPIDYDVTSRGPYEVEGGIATPKRQNSGAGTSIMVSAMVASGLLIL